MSSPTRKLRIIAARTFVMMFGLLLALVLFATPTQAQSFLVELGLYKSGTNDRKPPVFRVRAMKDKKVYDTLEGTFKGIGYKLKVKGRCPEKHHLTDSSISLYNGSDRTTRVIFPVNENNRSIGGDHGQEWNYYNLDFPFLLPRRSPVASCNAEVKRRVGQGESLAAILQKGFTLFVDDAYQVDLLVGCEKNVHLTFYETPEYLASAQLPAEVQCAATGYVQGTSGGPATQPQHYDPPPQRVPPPPPPVNSVSVAANPAETKGRACPVYVNFGGRIVASPDSVYQTFNTKYRFLGDHNYQSDWLFVAVKRGEPKIVNGRRFIEAPANDPGGTILAPGEQPKIPLYRGWMELEVQLPNGSKRSERTNFTVDCNVAPARPRIKASN